MSMDEHTCRIHRSAVCSDRHYLSRSVSESRGPLKINDLFKDVSDTTTPAPDCGPNGPRRRNDSPTKGLIAHLPPSSHGPLTFVHSRAPRSVSVKECTRKSSYPPEAPGTLVSLLTNGDLSSDKGWTCKTSIPPVIKQISHKYRPRKLTGVR